MFCPNCSCELPAVAKFCVKCGPRVEVPATTPRMSGSACLNCAKPLDSSDKFCSYCGHEVMHSHSQVAQMASDIATRNFEKFAERYSQMLSDDLLRLSADLSQLTDVAQKALIREIAKRGLNDSPAILEQTHVGAPSVEQPQPNVQAVSTPSSSTAQVAPIQAIATAQGAAAVTPQKGPSVPYAKFVGQLLLFCFSTSVGIFSLFDAFARNTTAFAAEALSLLLTLFFGWLAWTTWKSILKSEPRNELKSKRRVRNALVTSVVFILLYLGLAAFLGSIIGQYRAEAIQFNFDGNHQRELADRITKTRNAVTNTIPSYLAMYAAIEPDVKDYSSTLSRLREDLGKYDDKFPAQNEATHKYIASIEREIRRSDLLAKQIAAAKRIGLLDEEQQWTVWQSDMVPLLKEEDGLDQTK
jgi:hypothetical protein